MLPDPDQVNKAPPGVLWLTRISHQAAWNADKALVLLKKHG
jgi:hypothetical protein